MARVHVAVDDGAGGCAIGPSDRPNRLAHVEVLPDERKASATAFLLRALRWSRGHGIVVERVLTDNGSACRSRRFRKARR
ncbi:hypothetical protein [Albidovulum sp.]